MDMEIGEFLARWFTSHRMEQIAAAAQQAQLELWEARNAEVVARIQGESKGLL
jgi:hypothetical protein